eukprot:4741717-Prymnesium_polylepis.1
MPDAKVLAYLQVEHVVADHLQKVTAQLVVLEARATLQLERFHADPLVLLLLGRSRVVSQRIALMAELPCILPCSLEFGLLAPAAHPQLARGMLPRDRHVSTAALTTASRQNARHMRRIAQEVVVDVAHQCGPLVIEHTGNVKVLGHVIQRGCLVLLIVKVHVDAKLGLQAIAQHHQQSAVAIVVAIHHEPVKHEHGRLDLHRVEERLDFLEEPILGVAEHEVQERALFVGLTPVCLPAPRGLFRVWLEARQRVIAHQRRLDDVLDIRLILVEEGIRDAPQLLVGIGGNKEESLAGFAVLTAHRFAELREVVLPVLYVLTQLGAVNAELLHVDDGHEPLAKRAPKSAPHVLHALGAEQAPKVFATREPIGALHPRLADDGCQEILELDERGLKVLVRLAVMRRRARVVLPEVVDRER